MADLKFTASDAFARVSKYLEVSRTLFRGMFCSNRYYYVHGNVWAAPGMMQADSKFSPFDSALYEDDAGGFDVLACLEAFQKVSTQMRSDPED